MRLNLARRLSALIRRNRLDAELEDEIDLHIALRRQALVDDGMDPREAAYEARRMFGNVTVKREESREMWGFPSLDTIVQDLRYGLRLLGRSPVFTVISVLSLAIGIGSTAAVFSLADALVLQKLPAKAPDELAAFGWQAGPRNPAGRSPATSPATARRPAARRSPFRRSMRFGGTRPTSPRCSALPVSTAAST